MKFFSLKLFNGILLLQSSKISGQKEEKRESAIQLSKNDDIIIIYS